MNIAPNFKQDPSRQDYSQPETTWIAVDDAAQMFAEAKMPRNPRTVRRYCMRGDLECQKTENSLHQPQYFISKASVETYIEQQRTLMAGRLDTSGPSQAQPDLSGHLIDGNDTSATRNLVAGQSDDVQTDPDQSGRVPVGPEQRPQQSRLVVEQLEARIKDKDAEITFLRGELLHRRTTDTALHDVIAAFRANAEAQRLMAAPPAQAMRQSSSDWPSGAPSTDETRNVAEPGTSEQDEFAT